ncbi:MAG: DUF927 domain-containing protein [Pseudomonadota bacterium]
MQKTEHGKEATRQAREVGLVRADGRDFTANHDGAELSPDGWLIYPHLTRGKVSYFSSRAISDIAKGSKSRNLPGQRQTYRVTLGVDGKPLAREGLVIVEGPADAETLRTWGWPSIALCGCSIREEDNPALVAYLRKKAEQSTVYLALSNDDAGERGTETLADQVGPTVRVVKWPPRPGTGKEKGDANDWLQRGASAADAGRLLDGSPAWMQILLQRAEGDRTEEAIRDVVAAFGRLNVFAQSMWKRNIVRGLDITVADFENMLRATGEDLEGDLQQSEYAVRSGMLCLAQYGERGRQYRVLCNFDARIARDVVEDDGQEQLRYFVLAGRSNVGRPLPEVEVEAGEFHKMGWVLPSWGSAAMIAAGSSTTDHLRAAIQALSENVTTQYVYSHLGWRNIGGTWRYLSAAGAIGLEDVQVRLPSDLKRYSLPGGVAHASQALQASLRFLDTGDHHITIPLLAAMYLAPLSTLLPPSFTIWLFGTTGSLKSTITALAMCHFGTFAYNTPPASWTATSNALEKLAFVAKDAPLWIDDYTAQSTVAGLQEIRRKSDQLLRDWGNRTAKNRMRADLQLRRSFVPRGLIISTAEQLPPGPSIIPRLFAIEIRPDSMTRGEGSALTHAQAHDSQLYPHAMVGYLQWLSGRWDELEDTLKERHLRYTETARHNAGAHLRMPGNVGTMFVGWDLFLEYAAQAGALDDERADALREEGWAALLEIGEYQHSMVREENPVEIFITSLQQLFAQGQVYLRHKDSESSDTPDQNCWPRSRAVQCELLGWYDELYWYLLPQSAFNAVAQFCRRGGTLFPDASWGLRAKLAETNILLKQGERFTYRMPFTDSSKPRVWRIQRPTDNADEIISLSPRSGTAGDSGNSGNKDHE